jgi:uncharacterized sulfatase
MIVGWPAGLPAGKTIDEPAMHIDLLPTLAAAAGVPEPASLDGLSLLPLMTGASAVSPHDYLYFFTDEEVVGVRSGRWKLLTHAYYRRILGALENVEVLNGFDGPYPLLFDMAGPTGERYSLARENPDIVARLGKQIAAARMRFDSLRTRAPMDVYPPAK